MPMSAAQTLYQIQAIGAAILVVAVVVLEDQPAKWTLYMSLEPSTVEGGEHAQLQQSTSKRIRRRKGIASKVLAADLEAKVFIVHKPTV